MRRGGRLARLRQRPDLLGRWCAASERSRDRFRRIENESAVLGRRLLARSARLFFDLLVLVLLALAELDLILHRAGNALVCPRR